MAENSKYDLFMDELNSLEKQIYLFKQETDEISDENLALRKKVAQLEEEQRFLRQKYEEIQAELNSYKSGELAFSSENELPPEERKILKNKLNDLITKIDYHLRS
ncbi:MAG: hypothetical protein K8F36_06920 [Melioribacteraceae bacterium]|nr:hypothetical protein [Melioribacteraceae bacterium]MCO6472458.1 hypothetical protein [Melioribacteraceae bacterium]MDD3559403.1 hypothetical protein [Melioribacteraceae bacterium]